eukprot:sb/3473392/
MRARGGVRFKRLDLKFLEIGAMRVVFTKRDPEFPGISGQCIPGDTRGTEKLRKKTLLYGGGLSTGTDRSKLTTNQNSLSANQRPVFPDLVCSWQGKHLRSHDPIISLTLTHSLSHSLINYEMTERNTILRPWERGLRKQDTRGCSKNMNSS